MMRKVLALVLLTLCSAAESIAVNEMTFQIFEAGPSNFTVAIKVDGQVEFKRRNKKANLSISEEKAKKLISLSRKLVAAVFPLALESSLKSSPPKLKNIHINYNVTVFDEHSHIGVSFNRETEEYNLLARELKQTLSEKAKTPYWRRVK